MKPQGRKKSLNVKGAKKFALKAQNLFPGLEGISQLLAVLDVHLAAENKVSGESDYYGILGVNPLADDDTVKKHYRKQVYRCRRGIPARFSSMESVIR